MKTSAVYRQANRMARLAFLRAFEGGDITGVSDCDPGLSLPGSVRGVMADLVHETEAQAIFYASVEALVATKVNAVLAEKGEGPFFCPGEPTGTHTAPAAKLTTTPSHGQGTKAGSRRVRKGRGA